MSDEPIVILVNGKPVEKEKGIEADSPITYEIAGDSEITLEIYGDSALWKVRK